MSVASIDGSSTTKSSAPRRSMDPTRVTEDSSPLRPGHKESVRSLVVEEGVLDQVT
jgi:hypothetical protein